MNVVKISESVKAEAISLFTSNPQIALQEIAKALNISLSSVQRCLKQYRTPQNHRRWTEKELKFLERHAEKLPVQIIAKRLRRSLNSVTIKANRLGYSTIPTLDNYSACYLARELGFDRTTVKGWITQGLLRATKVTVNRWMIKSRDFATFCQMYPKKVSKCDPEVLLWLGGKC